MNDSVEFVAIPNPMIVGFTLPEEKTGSAEYEIGFSGAGLLDCARDVGHWYVGI